MRILPPVTVIFVTGSGAGAGPATTEPSVILNLLPWQGQSIVPSATWLHRHPTWVQTALKALNSPLAGWVTTTLAAAKILPPPTGMSAAAPRTVTPPLALEGLAPPAAALAGAGAAVVAPAPGAFPASSAS